MIKYLNVLCTREQITMLVFLLFGSLATVVFEFISIGSIPIFTTIIINQQSESQLFKIIDFNFFKKFYPGRNYYIWISLFRCNFFVKKYFTIRFTLF